MAVPEMTGADVLVECLLREGVRYVFGVPGAQPLVLVDAIYRRRERGIEFVMTRHEQAAAHMADAWSRVTGQVGVCLGTVGPGVTDLVPGVAAAWAEGSPMLVLAAQNQSWRIYPHHGSQQECHQLGLFSTITKWNACCYHFSRIPELVRAAFRAALAGRPGPVHLDLPCDILYQKGEVDPSWFWDPASYRATRGPAAPADLVEEAARLLTEAARPLLHLGGGVLRSGAWEEARLLAEHLGAAVTTTVGARGAIPDDHPQALLAAGYGAMAAQSDADVVLAVGCRFGELDMWGRPPAWAERGRQTIIQVDVDPQWIGVNVPVSLGVVGDARVVLAQLLEAVRERTPPRDPHPGLEEYRLAQESWLAEFLELGASEARPIHPLRLIKDVRDFFPREAIVCVDGGNMAVWANYLTRIYEPRSFLWAGDMGHLGAGLPFALAAKLAYPERPVFVLHGDGSFMFMPQELETARRLGLAVVDVIGNDRAYGMIKGGQKMAFGGRYVGVDFHDVRYDELARAMGCYGERVDDPADLRPALERAVASGLPAVLDVLIDQEAGLAAPDTVTLVDLWLEGCDV